MGSNRVFGVKVLWAVAFALLLMAIPASAQLPTGTILGNVKDTTGASVPGAMVTIRNIDTGASRTITSAQDGTFNVPSLPTGHYEVKAEHEGFKTENRTGITLEVTQQAVINFTLEVGSTTQEVVVSGEAPIVNTQDATLGGLVNEQYMTDLPVNGRNYVDLSLIEPGVNQDKNSSGGKTATSFSVNGAGPRSNNFTLDGAVTVTQEGRSPANAAAGSTLGMDGIKEFKIITSEYPAEYGLAMGSQVVVVSKGGTNQFHGDVFEYFRNNKLDARNFFAKTADPPFRKNQFGGSGGGPIKKDKTFVYGVFEALRQTSSLTSVNTVPAPGCHAAAGATVTAAQCPDIAPLTSVVVSPAAAQILPLFEIPTGSGLLANGIDTVTVNTAPVVSEYYGQMRVDHNFSADDSVFVRYTIDNAILNTPSAVVLGNSQQQNDRNQWLSVGENHIFSPAVLNTFRLSFSRTRVNTAGVDPTLGPSIMPGQPLGNVCVGGENCPATYVELAAGSTTPIFALQNIYTLSDDVNWTTGKHSFKFGTLINKWNEGVQSVTGQLGQVTYQDLAHFMLAEPNLLEFRALTANGNRFNRFSTLGFYGQDAWRVSQRLTLNLGLRYEFATVPQEMNGRQSRVINDFTDPFTVGPIIAQHSLHNFSPRVGIAYDVFGNGKTAVRGGFGMYYDIGNIGGALEQDVIGSPPFSGLVDIFAASSPSVNSYWPVSFPLNSKILATGANATTPQFIDYNWKSPYMLQYNLSVQQQLPWDMGISVGYVGNHGVHLPTVRDSNPIFPTSTVSCASDISGVCVTGGVVDLWDSGSPKFTPINPNMPSTINVATVSDSRYNALQIVLNKRTSHGLEFQTSYVYSKVLDDTQGQENVRDCSVGAGIQGTDTLHTSVDRGPACFNIPHNFQFSMVYHFPKMTNGNAILKGAANGWWVGNIVSVESGLPISVVLQGNRSNQIDQGQQDRANINTAALIAAFPCNGTTECKSYTPIPFNKSTVIQGTATTGPETVQPYLNSAMFSISPETLSPASEQANCPVGAGTCTIGQLGNAGRDFLQAPHARDWAFSLVKDTKVGFLGEAGLVQFRAEMFNVLNHPDFAPPNTNAFAGNQPDLGPFSEKPGSSFGKITAQQNIPRQIQLALRIEF
jgi:Carboxypeptidase regulatory-like domain/TonB dependent receptor/TonB-dependent Receptor Plug Domain